MGKILPEGKVKYFNLPPLLLCTVIFTAVALTIKLNLDGSKSTGKIQFQANLLKEVIVA